MSVIIRLIRNEAGMEGDDVIIIRRSDNNILVRYTDRQSKLETRQNLLLTNTTLSDYVKNIGQMFLNDADPFKCIQFAFPGFPVFLATHETLRNTETQDMLMEIADIVSDSMFADAPYVPK